MERRVTVSELRANLRAYVDEVVATGEALVVTRYGVPAAVLMPYSEWEGLAALAHDVGAACLDTPPLD